MLERTRHFAETAHGMKNMTSRLSVITYAESATTDIQIDDFNSYDFSLFSDKLNKLQWKNQGSFLNKGLDELEKAIGNSVCLRGKRHHENTQNQLNILSVFMAMNPI